MFAQLELGKGHLRRMLEHLCYEFARTMGSALVLEPQPQLWAHKSPEHPGQGVPYRSFALREKVHE